MKLHLFLLFSLCSAFIFGQREDNSYPQNYFSSPLDIPLLLSGNFGELRSNHFHAGIDIKTKGVEGHNVLASAEGFVSRVKVQERGYGKVVYIDHPNGYTTVYAHLQSFKGAIADSVKALQYANESYTIDHYFAKNALPITQKQIIALSGNTGGSGGAHLHFEIRETKSEIPVNPLLFNFKIKDNIPPVIKGVLIYPLTSRSTVNGHIKPVFLKPSKAGKGYQINGKVEVSGQFGIGLQTNDYLNNSNNRCGVYDIAMSVNSEKVYEYKTDKISFDESRFINAHCDYAYKKRTGKWIHKVFTLPNDGLNIYPLVVNNGVVNVLSDSLYKVKIHLEDVYNNATNLSMTIKGVEAPLTYLNTKSPKVVSEFKFTKENTYQTDSFKVYIPNGALYDDLDFEYEYKHNAKFYSGVHVAHNFTVPLHKAATFSILCNKTPTNPDKVVVISQHKKYKSYMVGKYINGWVNFNTRYFGTFIISEDVKAPSIKSLNVSNGKNVSNQKTLMFKITDDKSGIKSYKGYINGKWVLFEYDYKKKRLTHVFDGKHKKGTNQLKMVVTDRVGNQKVFECQFIY